MSNGRPHCKHIYNYLMVTLSPGVLGFLRGVGVVVLAAVISYLADATHLQGVVSAPVAALIAAVALGFEQHISDTTGKALFGAAVPRK